MMEKNWIQIEKSVTDFEDFGDEIVIIDSRNGVFYALKGRAMVLWRALGNGLLSETIEVEVKKLELEESSVLNAMLCSFLESGILESSVKSGPFEPTEMEGWSTAKPAGFERNADFDDLIKLDPLHDVGDKGWPYKGDNS